MLGQDPYVAGAAGDSQRERKLFKKKFGRYPRPDEPLFFDPDAGTRQPFKLDILQESVLQAMKAAGTPADVICAYKKTGRQLTDDRRHRYGAAATAKTSSGFSRTAFMTWYWNSVV